LQRGWTFWFSSYHLNARPCGIFKKSGMNFSGTATHLSINSCSPVVKSG
jgi:hypothetical protein